MDFKLTNDLDIDISNNEVQNQEDGETTMLQAFFTDKRIGGQRGYWIDDVLSSGLWEYDQKRLTNDVLNELNEEARDIANQLVEKKLYSKISTNVSISNGVPTLHIIAYDKKNEMINRKFAL